MNDTQAQTLIQAIQDQNNNIKDILSKLPIKSIKNLSFEEVLKMINAGDIAEPVIMRISLDTAAIDTQFGIVGNYFGIINADSQSSLVAVKFNRQSVDGIPFSQGLYMSRPFNQVFLSWTAQAGAYVDIIYGAYAKELLEVNDYRSATVQTTLLEDIKDNVQYLSADNVTDLFIFDFMQNTTTKTIYTVPTGKVLYIRNASLALPSSGSISDYLALEIWNNSGTPAKVAEILNSGGSAISVPINNSLLYIPSIKVLAGYTIRLVGRSTGADALTVQNGRAAIIGFLK